MGPYDHEVVTENCDWPYDHEIVFETKMGPYDHEVVIFENQDGSI
jgi:hypothetical protein